VWKCGFPQCKLLNTINKLILTDYPGIVYIQQLKKLQQGVVWHCFQNYCGHYACAIANLSFANSFVTIIIHHFECFDRAFEGGLGTSYRQMLDQAQDWLQLWDG